MKKIKKIYLGIKFLIGVIKLIRNPNDISPIFKIKEFRDHQSFKLAIANAKSDPDLKELFDTRYLMDAPADIEVLSNLSEGSLGYVFARHMKHFKMKAVFYPKMEEKTYDDITYLRYRARETHDIHHAVLGMNPDHLGEMSISAFYLAQLNIPLSAALLGVGFFTAVIKKPYMLPMLVEAIIKGWNMGKKAKNIHAVKWEELWDKDIDELRNELRINVESETYEQEHQRVFEKELKHLAVEKIEKYY
ncbi:MAG: Coq4 family protein [Bacteriovoracaceae bacterium]|jgi:ubiquinone biosynthesis protein Coq4|nr:Coq4 family protein [Bacteriovoracaceae bacterium]